MFSLCRLAPLCYTVSLAPAPLFMSLRLLWFHMISAVLLSCPSQCWCLLGADVFSLSSRSSLLHCFFGSSSAVHDAPAALDSHYFPTTAPPRRLNPGQDAVSQFDIFGRTIT
ncbi:hypothetical protein JB92DRAFT_2871983, partial [Gautieria morchelliformis]